jgi:hypothetical protein
MPEQIKRQRRSGDVSEEMVSLFKRGTELKARGHDDSDDHTERGNEFISVSKRLHWDHFHVVSCCASVFDDEAAPPARFLEPQFASQLEDWQTVRAWRQALLQAVAEGS